MASFYKTASGWRVQIQRRGVRMSRTFATKAAAAMWAAQEERAILDGEVSRWPRKTVWQAFERYGEEVSAKKRSGPAEVLRFAATHRDYPALTAKLISEVTAGDVAAWRDDRLRKVTPGSVQRDINLLRNVWTVAVREWQWTGENPWSRIQMPGQNAPRDRLLGWREIRRLLRRCSFRTGVMPQTSQEIVAWAFLVALRTGLRAGELLSLTGETVDLQRRVVTLTSHKTLETVGKRQVPLTPQAVRLLRVLWRPGQLLMVSNAVLDALFRKMRDQLMLPDLHFHDSRATALTHLAKRVDVMVLARISGHKNLSLLHGTYYRETAEQIAARLASPRR